MPLVKLTCAACGADGGEVSLPEKAMRVLAHGFSCPSCMAGIPPKAPPPQAGEPTAKFSTKKRADRDD